MTIARFLDTLLYEIRASAQLGGIRAGVEKEGQVNNARKRDCTDAVQLLDALDKHKRSHRHRKEKAVFHASAD